MQQSMKSSEKAGSHHSAVNVAEEDSDGFAAVQVVMQVTFKVGGCRGGL